MTDVWKPTSLAEGLDPFMKDPTDSGVVVIGDDDATRVLVAFRNTEHSWRMPMRGHVRLDSSLVAKWKWLTCTWRIDIDALAEATGLSIETVEVKVDVLVANRLIYPDGTLARGAQIALQANANMKLGGKPGRTAARGAAAKETK